MLTSTSCMPFSVYLAMEWMVEGEGWKGKGKEGGRGEGREVEERYNGEGEGTGEWRNGGGN